VGGKRGGKRRLKQKGKPCREPVVGWRDRPRKLWHRASTATSRLWFAKTLADCKFNNIVPAFPSLFCYNSWSCFDSLSCPSERWFASSGRVGACFSRISRCANKLGVLKRRHPKATLGQLDKLFWFAVRRFWSGWKQSLIVVTPETVVRWHRAGFRLYWRLISRVRTPVERRPTSKEVRELIFRMVVENPNWGAPRIHGELLMLGFDLSERSVSRWMKQVPRDPGPAQRWRAFLRNHREAIAAMDFFTVPTITFGGLYCFFVIRHDRRRILHFNVTKHPTSSWIIQQLRKHSHSSRRPDF